MIVFAHRVNTLEKLELAPKHFGIEVDVRGLGDDLFLSHDPLRTDEEYVSLEAMLIAYKKRGQTGGIIFNTKEAGYEQRILDLAVTYDIKNYFLLDVEFPYLYRATRQEGVREIAVRFSEAEPMEYVEAQMVDGKPLLDWVWIDTNTKLPLTADIVSRLAPFKTCLVCPERWGRPQDILSYIDKMKDLNFKPTAVMTSLEEAHQWEGSGL